MGKYQIKHVRQHIKNALQTKSGGKVYDNTLKKIFDPKKNAAIKKLPTYTKNVLRKIAFGNTEHTITDQEVQRALQQYKQVAKDTDTIKLSSSREAKASSDVAYKRIQKQQSTTVEGTPEEDSIKVKQLEERLQNRLIYERNRAMTRQEGSQERSYLDEKYSTPVRKGALSRDDKPETSISRSEDASNVNTGKGATTSVASDQGSTSAARAMKEKASGETAENKEQSKTVDKNPDTAPPTMAGGAGPTDRSEDRSPNTDNPTPVIKVNDSEKPTDNGKNKKDSKEDEEEDVPDISRVDIDLPL